MEKSVTFDDLWKHLEVLSDADIDLVHRAAGNSARYKTLLFGVYSLFVAAISALCFIGRWLYLAYSATMPTAIGIIFCIILAIWLGAKLVVTISHNLFDQAVMREIRLRQSENVA